MTLRLTTVSKLLRIATTLGVIGSSFVSTSAIAACTRPIVVATSPGLYFELDKDNRPSGLVLDFFEYIQAQTGCQFTYLNVPRARAFRMFEQGDADILPSVIQTPERDRIGTFAPIIRTRASLITLAKDSAKNPLLALESGELRVDVVRSFDYGSVYQNILSKLRTMKRLEEVSDASVVVRKMEIGRTDATIMVTSIFADVVAKNRFTGAFQGTVIPTLPITDTGLYLSAKRLDDESMTTLLDAVQNKAHLAYFWKLFTTGSPAWSLSSLLPAQ